MVKNTVLGFVHKRFDANGDGTLDKEELAAARGELTKRIIEGIPMGDAQANPSKPSKPVYPVDRKTPPEEPAPR